MDGAASRAAGEAIRQLVSPADLACLVEVEICASHLRSVSARRFGVSVHPKSWSGAWRSSSTLQ
jgi:hypothetical protein